MCVGCKIGIVQAPVYKVNCAECKIGPLVSNCKYHSIVLSDHSPVQMDLFFPANVAPQRTWRLDPQLLLCKHFRTYLNNQIDFFLEINDTQDVTRGVLWESMKAYLRGQVISYVAHRNKECSRQFKELADKIADIDRRYALSPMPDLGEITVAN